MGMLFCKIHSPFICFCTPSDPPCCLYSQAQLMLGCMPRVPSSTVAADGTLESTGEAGEVNLPQRIKQGAIDGCHIRSCIRKGRVPNQIEKKTKKKRVQWVDNLGQELAEIKEFECSEAGDTDNEEADRHCFCTIL